MVKPFQIFIYIFLLFVVGACTKQSETELIQSKFKLLSASETGIDFENTLDYDREFNIERMHTVKPVDPALTKEFRQWVERAPHMFVSTIEKAANKEIQRWEIA